MRHAVSWQVLGAPLASGLLLADGALGLHGWQWLFLVEGAPTIIAGLWVRWDLHSCLDALVWLDSC